MYDILTLVVGYPLAVGGMVVVSWFLGVIFDALGLNQGELAEAGQARKPRTPIDRRMPYGDSAVAVGAFNPAQREAWANAQKLLSILGNNQLQTQTTKNEG